MLDKFPQISDGQWAILEERMQQLCFAEAVSPHIDDLGRIDYGTLVDLVMKVTSVYASGRHSLGLDCGYAWAADRSYLFTLLSANGVLEAKQRLGRPVTFVELGMGTGMNCIAACIADKETTCIAYETNDDAIGEARLLFDIYGVADRIDIRREDFLNSSFDNVRADVVLNENMHEIFLKEPQLEAARAILPYTHEQTVFVPDAFDVWLRPRHCDDVSLKEDLRLGTIRMSQTNELPVTLAADIDAATMPRSELRFTCVARPLNYAGQQLLRNDNGLGQYSTSKDVHIHFDPIQGRAQIVGRFQRSNTTLGHLIPEYNFSLRCLP